MRDVRVQIDKLVLAGVDPLLSQAIVTAMEDHLSRQSLDWGALGDIGPIDSIQHDLGPGDLIGGAEAIGRSLADKVCAAVNPVGGDGEADGQQPAPTPAPTD